MDAENSVDGLPHYVFRKGGMSWEDFLKSFTKVGEIQTVLNPLTTNDLADLFAKLEEKEERVDCILMNARTYVDVRKWGHNRLDVRTKKEDLAKGWMADIWGAYIIVNRRVPDGIVLATSEQDANLGAILTLGQETSYNLEGLNALKDKAADLSCQLNKVYSEIKDMIDRSLSSLKK
jgi:hypothetical protein